MKMRHAEALKVSEFVDYVMSFYGKGGLYEMDATRAEVLVAIIVRLEREKSLEFAGDTIDREKVRDIIIEIRGVDRARIAA